MSVIHGRISSRRKDSGTNGARVIAGFNPDIRSPDYEVSIRQRPFRFTLRENLTTVESGQLISSLNKTITDCRRMKFDALCNVHKHERAVTVDSIQMRWVFEVSTYEQHREISPISPHESLPLRIARPPYNFRVRSYFYFNKAVIFFFWRDAAATATVVSVPLRMK
ncbi:uncharacterized protein LOC115238611 isoform X1 [Formica exsecta]|uniref:uncharacterized protein LOC115238611 isoform X1 n=1 Tax=Formica exsecta TaxID=72781 RepID=UPI001141D7A3|nr:uncharacterized protein LOC115238611 isoform X1 [Formica exsecta]